MASSALFKFPFWRSRGTSIANHLNRRLQGQRYFIDQGKCVNTLHFKIPPVTSVLSPELQRSCTITTVGSCGCYNNTPCAAFHSDVRKLAGHNKWSKVKHIKGPKDAARSKEFNKISLKLKYSVQRNGPDPNLNAELKNIIEMAKSKGMPKSTMEMIISKASIGKEKYISVILEARGPAGSCLLIDVLSDNVNRSRQEIYLMLKKLGCALGESGTAMYAFSKKGVIKVPAVREDNSNIALDDALEIAIESGAEDVQEVEDDDEEPLLMFLCDPKDVRQVRNDLISKELHPVSVNLEYVLENPVTLKDSQLQNAAEVISQLSDHADVVRVYDNIVSEN
ncbi:translational activator of cytochrome c oxidase 1-like [Glandiceps talaboti]